MRQEDDKFARESFTFRRMKRWQVWALVGAVVIVLIVAYALL
ncbi:hypothetical protein NTH_01201 [Nitratireductor thuwali]|uniref:Uncharacterized protein n=1 Tax=Nitratireductor thuwali TaxID=2267699 RepID=A0ABY5MIQ6_9HYPH|nr:hypothetical protein NTH_01201 [Nitratireductor thuwali]